MTISQLQTPVTILWVMQQVLNKSWKRLIKNVDLSLESTKIDFKLCQ